MIVVRVLCGHFLKVVRGKNGILPLPFSRHLYGSVLLKMVDFRMIPTVFSPGKTHKCLYKRRRGSKLQFFIDNLYGRRLISSTSPHSYIKDAFNVQLKVKTEKKRKISTNNCKTKDNLLNTMHEKQKKSRANALRQERQQKADHDWRRTTHDDTWEWITSLFYFLLNYLTISFI